MELVRYSLCNKYRLSSGYSPLAYIENTSTAYIDTGFKYGSGEMSTYIDYTMPSNSGSTVMGSSNDNTKWCLLIHCGVSGTTCTRNHYCGTLSAAYSKSEPAGTRVKTLYTISGTNVTVKDDRYDVTNKTGWTASCGTIPSLTYTYLLFAHHYGSTVNLNAKCRMYGCKIWYLGSLVRDFVPALKESGSVVGMFDLVGLQFYASANSATFTAGPPLIAIDPSYQQVEWIKTGSTQTASTSTVVTCYRRSDMMPGLYTVSTGAFEAKSGYLLGPTASSGGLVEWNGGAGVTTSNYRYFRFTIFEVRSGAAVLLSRIRLNNGSNDYSWSGATCTATDYALYNFEQPSALVDNSISTKYLSYAFSGNCKVTIDAGTNIDLSTYKYFCWDTANDSNLRDPMKFRIEVSKDGVNYMPLGTFNQSTTTTRQVEAFRFDMTSVLSKLLWALPHSLHSSPLHPLGTCHNLPVGYLEVEWLDSNGTQYLDTEFQNTTENIRYKVKLMSKELGSAYYTYRTGGAYNSSNNSRSGILYLNYSTVYIGAGNTDVNTGVAHTANTIRTYDITCNSGTISGTVDSTSFSKSYSGSLITSKNILLFANNESGTPNYKGKVRLYYCQIYEGGVLKRDLYPCIRTSDGVAGMYCRVQNKFYTPTGTLLPGPAIGRNEGGTDFSNGYIQSKADLSTLCNSRNYTISFWMYPTELPADESATNWKRIFCVRNDGDNADGHQLVVYLSNTGIGSSFWNNDTEKTISGLAANKWYHVALTQSGATQIVYINGTSLGTNSKGTSSVLSGSHFDIGKCVDRGMGQFKGCLYDFRIFDTALNGDAIKAIYLAK